MSVSSVKAKLQKASIQDPSIICEKDKVSETLGSNPDYLKDVFNITKSDLIRLEREGLAMKARYEVEKTREHRIRWLIFKEALE
jgi:hypothetical protein